MKKIILPIILVVSVSIFAIWNIQKDRSETDLQRIVINEAARTLLYLPMYHAISRGYFADEGLEVVVMTGGSAANSFAAMMSGEAMFALADPMYVPIAREKAADAKVVGQVVGRVAIWMVGMDATISTVTPDILRNKTVSTHQRPMSAYTFTTRLLNQMNLEIDKDVRLIAGKPGSELPPFLQRSSDFMVSVEPNVSIAVAQGAHVVHSFATEYQDLILSALMSRESTIIHQKELVDRVLRAFERAMKHARENPEESLETCKQYFPQIDEAVAKLAVQRLIDEQVIPNTTKISRRSWDKAIQVRIDAGDLQEYAPIESSVIASSIAD